MDNETEVIRNQMDETRTSLQDKLETLEQQVKDTVQETTETVQTVTEAVQETVETVKDTVQETVVSIKQSLDLSQHVRAHPWLFFAGATAAGFIGGRLLSGGGHHDEPSPGDATPVTYVAAPRAPRNGAKTAPAAPSQPSFWQRMLDKYSDEVGKLQGLAVATLAAVVREMVVPAAPPALAEQVGEILDNVTTKLGGTPLHGSLFQSSTHGEGGSEVSREAQAQKPGWTAPRVGAAGFEGSTSRFSNTPGDG
jgi:ElaB/YqjD/DUF883 family membrane-anchored ribosome-binding protein